MLSPKLALLFLLNKKELLSLINKLVIDNKPTIEYKNMLEKQRNWLLEFGTTTARAKEILKVLSDFKN